MLDTTTTPVVSSYLKYERKTVREKKNSSSGIVCQVSSVRYGNKDFLTSQESKRMIVEPYHEHSESVEKKTIRAEQE